MVIPSLMRLVQAAARAADSSGSVAGATVRSENHRVSNPRRSASVTIRCSPSGSGCRAPADTAKRTFNSGSCLSRRTVTLGRNRLQQLCGLVAGVGGHGVGRRVADLLEVVADELGRQVPVVVADAPGQEEAGDLAGAD